MYGKTINITVKGPATDVEQTHAIRYGQWSLEGTEIYKLIHSSNKEAIVDGNGKSAMQNIFYVNEYKTLQQSDACVVVFAVEKNGLQMVNYYPQKGKGVKESKCL